MAENHLRTCSRCKQDKLPEEYTKNKFSWCRLCDNKRRAEWRKTSPKYEASKERNRVPKPTEKVCEECQKSFLPYRRRENQTFCSNECRMANRKRIAAAVVDMPIVCSKCGEEGRTIDYPKSIGTKNGRYSWCKKCENKRREKYRKTPAHAAYMEKHKEKHKKKNRNNMLKLKYGVTDQEYGLMLASQGGKCALCGTTEAGSRSNTFQIDHCHTTGRIRGLLCWSCNVGLGKLGDTLEALERAVEYLRGLPTLEI